MVENWTLESLFNLYSMRSYLAKAIRLLKSLDSCITFFWYLYNFWSEFYLLHLFSRSIGTILKFRCVIFIKDLFNWFHRMCVMFHKKIDINKFFFRHSKLIFELAVVLKYFTLLRCTEMTSLLHLNTFFFYRSHIEEPPRIVFQIVKIP